MSENKSYDSSDQFNQKNESQKHCILWDKKKVQVSINKYITTAKGVNVQHIVTEKGRENTTEVAIDSYTVTW